MKRNLKFISTLLFALAVALLFLGLNVEGILLRIVLTLISAVLFVGYFVSQFIKTRNS